MGAVVGTASHRHSGGSRLNQIKSGHHARTRTDYSATSLSGATINLPVDTYEYEADATTVLRRTHIVYNMDTTYTNLRIIGLPSAKYICDGAQGEVTCNDQSGSSLVAKVSFDYDQGSLQNDGEPVQHDSAYVAGFSVRGNLSKLTRYDVTNISQSTTSTLLYNTAGSVVKSIDAATHETQISYADAFAANGTTLDTGRPLTLAYPTMVTDPDGYTAKNRYNYDFGAPTWKQTPLPNIPDNQPGPEQTIAYDPIGRVQRVTNLVNNAYTRYEYPASQNRVDTYTTIQDNAGEAHSFRVTDGHGRVIGSAADHPGSAGGFSGQLIYYDLMGRSVKSSNPTETGASSTSGNPYDWPATGDDAAAGWIYTQQTYDWKGRPLVTTNTDGTTKQASYGGCGCAGGEVVTLTDEGTIVNSQPQHRQQRIYSDVVGRTAKTEVLNWDSTVYATTVNSYNARDQVTQVRQYQGTDQSGVYQDTTMSYDGYGRLQTKHVPEQQVDPNNSSSTDHTTWAYNPDETIHSVTDARGASVTYGYVGNNRRLVTSISYNAPSGITTTSNVSFGYDAVGNRTSMTDGLGSKSYNYNQLSQLMSETRTITSVGTFTLSYDYNLAGELKKISDPANATINYGFDSV